VERLEPGLRRPRSDQVAVEEPMEIRVEFSREDRRVVRTVTVTMRTPGHDFELAAGFLLSEGLLSDPRHVREITYCQEGELQEYNVVSLRLTDGAPFDETLLTRAFYTSSSCGVCGQGSLEAVEVRGCQPLPPGSLRLPAPLVASLPDVLLDGQKGFRRTGGLHAAGIFDGTGELQVLREDVGRHNAVDKAVGWCFLERRVPLTDTVMVVSGRTSFEIMQKALAAGIPMVVAVGAPSSLAVEMARRFGQTLVGFTREKGFNVYAGDGRIVDWEGGRR
jgi:FdhD protein